MAEVYAPVAKDESFKTSESPSRNVADVLAQELARIAENILPPNAEDIAYDNTASGLTATNVQDAIDEVISTQADVIADTMADLTENKTATVTDGVADFETIDGSLVKSLVVEIEPSQSGTGTPSPSNIRPISGYTQEDVFVVGKNWADIIQGNCTTDGTITSDSTKLCNSDYIPVKAGQRFTVSAVNLTSPTKQVYFRIFSTKGTDNIRRSNSWANLPLTIDIQSGEYYLQLIFRNNDNSEITPSDANIQLELGNTATTFEPYHGKTYTTPFGQTVYGGTLDVLTGELTIDKWYVQITAQNVTFNSTNNRGLIRTNLVGIPYAISSPNTVNCICDKFEGITQTAGVVTGNVGVYAHGQIIAICGYKTSLEDYQSWLTDNPVTVVYEIETPQTIQLTPQTVKALVGENHIQASTGDVTICKYSKLVNGDDIYIADDNAVLISAMGTDESGNTKASKAYTTGDYFYKDGAMCKVLTSIASGATLTLNTNYSALTLADILKSLA